MWISVKDKLPEEDDTVLFYSENGGILIGFWEIQSPRPFEEPYFTSFPVFFNDYGEEIEDYITHWQKLPEPPKEE